MHISHTERVTDKMNVEVIKELMKGEIEEKELPKVVERTLAYNRDGVLKELSMRDHRWVRAFSIHVPCTDTIWMNTQHIVPTCTDCAQMHTGCTMCLLHCMRLRCRL